MVNMGIAVMAEREGAGTSTVVLALAALVLAAGCDQNGSIIGSTDTSSDGDGPADPAGETAGDVPWEGEVIVPPGCGNGVVDTGEACDDGNTQNEPCDTTNPGACLGDCSLLMATCGNGSPDDGEQCDDGNGDSHDDCTTSCTVNDHSMGAPCTCDGYGCSIIDFAAGTIIGCENVETYANASRELACMRSASIVFPLYFAEGYCSLLAFRCEGSTCDDVGVREVGDVDMFSCPDGFAAVTRIESVMGVTLTSKTCHPFCTSHSQCRWNAVEDPDSPFSGCSDYACVPDGDGGEFICLDSKSP